MKYTEMTDRIIQIADDDGVYCTLVKGSEMALLFDTGFGKQPLREFVEGNISTEYIVVNSHGHPDHIGGNSDFNLIYAGENETDFILETHREITGSEPEYRTEKLFNNQIISLGDIIIQVVELPGHTRGSVGLLLLNERILLAGDALNPCLWFFTPGSTSLPVLIKTLKYAESLPFDNYIFGHDDKMLPHGFVGTILKNAESLCINPESRKIIMGIETYNCVYKDRYGKSVIVFTEDKVKTL